MCGCPATGPPPPPFYRPAVALREVRVEPVSDRVFRVTAQVANDGFLPTQSAIGARVRWQQPVRVTFRRAAAGWQLVGVERPGAPLPAD